MNQHQLAETITALRKQKNLTQKELARQLNVTDKAVSKWERGAGYPEITIVPALAKALGVSIDQLFGEKGELPEEDTAPSPPQQPPTPRQQAKALRQKQGRRRGFSRPFAYLPAKQMWEAVLSIFLLVSMLACLIVDVAVSGGATWSLYVVGSCVLCWCVVSPLLLFGRSRFLLGLTALTVLVLPYLMLVEFLCPFKGWLLPIALPAVGSGLALLWIIVLLKTFTRISWWLVGALVALVTPGLNFFINHRVAAYTGDQEALRGVQGPMGLINLLTAIIIALGLVCVWLIQRKKKRSRPQAAPVQDTPQEPLP